MVVVDELITTTHLIPIKSTSKAINIANIFMREIFRLHGVLKIMISNRDAKFASKFWKELFENMITKLNFSTSYHPQNNDQIERTNQRLKDMLRMYVKDKQTKWEDYLHLAKFAYNNGYQTSIKVSPFKVMYRRRCKVPLSWDHPKDKLVLGPYMLREMEEIVKKVKQNLKIVQDRQKSYASLKRTQKEFNVGDHVYLKVKPKKTWELC